MIFWNYKIEKFKSAYVVWFKPRWYKSSDIIYTTLTLDQAINDVNHHSKVNDENIRLKIIDYVK